MVLSRPSLSMLVALPALIACLGTTPPPRLETATPIALLVHLEASSGDVVPVPDEAARAIEAALSARNLVPARVPVSVLGDAKTSSQRVDALAKASDAGWIMLVEARATFFSQLSGRYRWEVEVRTSLAPRDRIDDVQASDLSVAAFLLFEHEAEADALAFVRRQVAEDLGALVDRVIIAR